jgi:hypothetical protein
LNRDNSVQSYEQNQPGKPVNRSDPLSASAFPDWNEDPHSEFLSQNYGAFSQTPVTELCSGYAITRSKKKPGCWIAKIYLILLFRPIEFFG